jgi:hypothetical protein
MNVKEAKSTLDTLSATSSLALLQTPLTTGTIDEFVRKYNAIINPIPSQRAHCVQELKALIHKQNTINQNFQKFVRQGCAAIFKKIVLARIRTGKCLDLPDNELIGSTWSKAQFSVVATYLHANIIEFYSHLHRLELELIKLGIPMFSHRKSDKSDIVISKCRAIDTDDIILT